MTFLIDTNVISEIEKRDRANRAVMAWMKASRIDRLYLSVITVMELEDGVLRKLRTDEKQGNKLRAWLDNQVRPQFAGRILVIDEPIALMCAPLNVPDRRPLADALIAATALVHNLTVVTRNTDDFQGTGVRLLNPWDHPA